MSDPIPSQELRARLTDEADLCRNDGADDIAHLLDEADDALSTKDEEIAQSFLSGVKAGLDHVGTWLRTMTASEWNNLPGDRRLPVAWLIADAILSIDPERIGGEDGQ